MKRDGTIYELQFRIEALKRNLDTFPPDGDYSPIDCIVLNPAGKAFRVQVKGTACVLQSDGKDRPIRKGKYRIVSGRSSNKTSYSATEIDVLACYIAPLDEWYLIPMVYAANNQSLAFFTHEGTTSKWQKYRNKWDIFLQ